MIGSLEVSRVVDASVWVSRLVPKDRFHSVVTSWMQEQRSSGGIFYAPSLLLPEAAGAISRRTGSPELASQALDRLQALPELRIVEMSQALVELAAKSAAALSLRGADSLYVALAAHLRLPLVTLDADQAERALGLVPVLGPAEFAQ